MREINGNLRVIEALRGDPSDNHCTTSHNEVGDRGQCFLNFYGASDVKRVTSTSVQSRRSRARPSSRGTRAAKRSTPGASKSIRSDRIHRHSIWTACLSVVALACTQAKTKEDAELYRWHI